MKYSITLLLAAYTAGALADVAAYGKCGGQGYTGETTCVSGFTCVYSNDYYSQCVPGAAPATSSKTTTKAATTTTSVKTTTKTSSSTTTTKAVTTTTSKTTTKSVTPTTTSTLKTTTKAATTTTGGVVGSTTFPVPAGTTAFPTAIVVSGVFDGKLLQYERNPSVCQGQTETAEADAMFILEDGAHIKNAIIGATQAEGIHCRGTCTIENVWWIDICEDAATFKQVSGTSYVIGGGARSASDKIFQFNGRGTVSISGFYAEDYGKLIRSCGDCDANGGPRNVVITGVTATKGSGTKGGPLCGINTNYGDTCRISNSCQKEGKYCDLYQGVTDHIGESTKLSSGPDGISCFVTGSSC